MFVQSPFFLALTLLMARILADDEDLAMRRMILHLSHIFLTEGRTFMSFPFGMRIVLYVHAQPLGECFLSCDRARRIRVFARGRPTGPEGDYLKR